MTPASSHTPPAPNQGNALQLTLATGAFAVCFAVFGSVSAMMGSIDARLNLTELQVWIAIALPVLLGSLGRIPLGMMTDKYGGRVVFICTMALAIIPTILLGFVNQYWQLLMCGFFVGIGLASFSVGAPFTSRWYPPHKQGSALGVYGAGNIGQSLASFGAPFIVAAAGYAWGFWTFAIAAGLWLVLFIALAENPPGVVRPKTLRESLVPMREPMAWALCAFYFLTFGGFVAMAISLPKFLTAMFELTPQDAGLRTAGFVVLATAMRPVGGILGDRIGGRRVLLWVFPLTAGFAIFLACPTMVTFTIGALGMAAAIGLGNGAVFKLVPEYFPRSVGAVTGLVGAAGGLGGFFPPLVVGALREWTGTYAWGFILLSAASIGCLMLVMRRTQVQPRFA
jgi:NNP family nitrate/nitrite transporter-like MFS transporter